MENNKTLSGPPEPPKSDAEAYLEWLMNLDLSTVNTETRGEVYAMRLLKEWQTGPEVSIQ